MMERLKKIIKAILFPPVAILILLVPLAATLLIYAFLWAGQDSVFSYVSYALSAYALTVLCVRMPAIIGFCKTLKRENRWINSLTTDAYLRAKLSLYGSLAVNLAYAVFQLGLGFYHGSFWFHSLALYYFLLSVMRFFLLRDVRTASLGTELRAEYKRYRFCGIVLLVMNLALAAMVFFITYFNRGFTHHFITTIALAAYTFTAMTVAIVNVVRYRKYQSPLLSASKAISLAAAAVSMLTLETAMLNAFGEANTESFRRIMTTATGAAVCAFVLAMAIYMIVHATKELKKQK